MVGESEVEMGQEWGEVTFMESIGGTARVADRMGFVRTESLGTSRRRSADLVSSFRRLGTLGRRVD